MSARRLARSSAIATYVSDFDESLSACRELLRACLRERSPHAQHAVPPVLESVLGARGSVLHAVAGPPAANAPSWTQKPATASSAGDHLSGASLAGWLFILRMLPPSALFFALEPLNPPIAAVLPARPHFPPFLATAH